MFAVRFDRPPNSIAIATQPTNLQMHSPSRHLQLAWETGHLLALMMVYVPAREKISMLSICVLSLQLRGSMHTYVPQFGNGRRPARQNFPMIYFCF